MRSYIKKLVNAPFSILLSAVCYLLFVSSANASALFFNPQDKIEIEEGESTVVEARLDTEGKTINVIDALIHFSPEAFEVLDVSRGDSALTLWIVDPLVDNADGTVRITGGIPSGASFTSGLVARITLQARMVGVSSLAFDKASQVLLNDGQGTKDALTVLDTPMTVFPALTDVPRVSSITHENQSKWYQNTTLFVFWPLKTGILYSYTLDHDPHGIPDETPDTPQGEMRFDGALKYEGLSEGVYYFHLRKGTWKKRELYPHTNELVWGRTRTFRAQIDTTPPDKLLAEVGSDPSLFEGKYFVSFSGSDALSGVDHYDVAASPGGWVERAVTPYQLHEDQKRQPVKVRVFDKAGNMREVSASYPPRAGKASSLQYVLIGIAILSAFCAGIWRYRRTRKEPSGMER